MPGLCPGSRFSSATTAKSGGIPVHNPAQLPKDRSEARKSPDFPQPVKGFVPPPDDGTPNPADLMVRSITVWQREGPTAVLASATSVREDAPAGSAIADLSMSRFGIGTGERFSIVDDPDGMFQIDGSKLRSRTTFDFARKQSHFVVVRATDSQGRTWQQPLTIDVLDAGHGRSLYIGDPDSSKTRPDVPANDQAASHAWSKTNVAVLDEPHASDGKRTTEFIREKATSAPAEFSISQLLNVETMAPRRYIIYGDFKPLGRNWIKAEVATADYSSNLQVYFRAFSG